MKKLFEHPWGTIIPGVLFLVALILAFLAFTTHTQEAEDPEDDGCRWHVVNLQGEGSQYYAPVNAVQWNDCTGDTYHFHRGNDTGNIVVDKLR